MWFFTSLPPSLSVSTRLSPTLAPETLSETDLSVCWAFAVIMFFANRNQLFCSSKSPGVWIALIFPLLAAAQGGFRGGWNNEAGMNAKAAPRPGVLQGKWCSKIKVHFCYEKLINELDIFQKKKKMHLLLRICMANAAFPNEACAPD